MSDNKLDISQIKSYWISEADETPSVAEHLFDKKDYSYALFFGHLAIEKILKSIYVEKNKEHAPPIHNLQRLARLVEVTLDEKNE